MSTTEIGRPNGKLVLPGAGSTQATVEVIYQSQATRASRALITLGVAILIAPVLFFLPPHFLWPIVALIAGGLLAWRYWIGEYYVTHFEGTCPRCETPIEMSRGTRIRGEHTLDCHGCHRHPTLVLNDPEHPPEEETETQETKEVEESEAVEEPAESAAVAEPETGETETVPTATDDASDGREVSERRTVTGDRRSPVGDRRDPPATSARPAPASDEPTAVLDEPASRPDELGG